MKSFIAAVILCACTLVTEEGNAAITCYPNPERTKTTCIDHDGRSWVTTISPNGTSTTIPLTYPKVHRAPPHNPSECTIVTGCLPGSR